MEDRTDFRNARTMLLHMHKSFWDRAREMSREHSMISFVNPCCRLRCRLPSAALVAPILAFLEFSDFRRSTFVAVVFAMEPCFPKNEAVNAWNCSIFGRSALSVK